MDTTLVMVTLLSMGMAGALSVIVWRMLRDERQRSDARVASLVALAAAPVSPVPVVSPIARQSPPPVDLPIRPAAVARRGAAAPAGRVGDLFVEHVEEESPWRNRFVVMAALGLVIASATLFTLAAKGRVTPRPASHALPIANAQPAAPPAAAQPGLELVSMRDARDGGALTITGMVRNPHTGALLTRVSVTAYAFDANGAFLASGRALLDVTSLTPGDESPFVVSVPVSGAVARYRIGFRGEDGRVIAHVDKRQQGPVAANW
jgi:hypothetical protein